MPFITNSKPGTAQIPVAIGDTITNLTAGSILFGGAAGVLAQDNSNLFFDDTNNRLGVGINSSLSARVHIKGSGSTPATYAFQVQNSSNHNPFIVRDDNVVFIGFTSFFPSSDKGNTVNNGSAGLFIGETASSFYVNIPAVTLGKPKNLPLVPTYDNMTMVSMLGNFAPSSGNAEFINTVIEPTINQTGTANGITRGLYINPTLTSAIDFRAIEVVSGKSVFGGVVRLKGYTVATLPAGTVGDTAYVTDALLPAFLVPIAGGGAVTTKVFYDGANWVAG